MRPRSPISKKYSLTSRQPFLVWAGRIGVPLGYMWAWALPAAGWLSFPCPFRWLTGWRCPGCGMGSASHALLHGHWVEASQFHALVLPFHLFIVVGYASLWLAGDRSFLFRSLAPRWAYASIGGVGLATLLINL